jgi:hypothetical protein
MKTVLQTPAIPLQVLSTCADDGLQTETKETNTAWNKKSNNTRMGRLRVEATFIVLTKDVIHDIAFSQKHLFYDIANLQNQDREKPLLHLKNFFSMQIQETQQWAANWRDPVHPHLVDFISTLKKI